MDSKIRREVHKMQCLEGGHVSRSKRQRSSCPNCSTLNRHYSTCFASVFAVVTLKARGYKRDAKNASMVSKRHLAHYISDSCFPS